MFLYRPTRLREIPFWPSSDVAAKRVLCAISSHSAEMTLLSPSMRWINGHIWKIPVCVEAAGPSIRVSRAARLRRIRVAWPSRVPAVPSAFRSAIAPVH